MRLREQERRDETHRDTARDRLHALEQDQPQHAAPGSRRAPCGRRSRRSAAIPNTTSRRRCRPAPGPARASANAPSRSTVNRREAVDAVHDLLQRLDVRQRKRRIEIRQRRSQHRRRASPWAPSCVSRSTCGRARAVAREVDRECRWLCQPSLAHVADDADDLRPIVALALPENCLLADRHLRPATADRPAAG